MSAPMNSQMNTLQAGDHLCLLYEGAAERTPALAPIFRAALGKGLRCLLLGSREEFAALTAALEASGVPVGEDAERGALVLLDSGPPAANPSAIAAAADDGHGALLDLLRQAEQEALDDGFGGLLFAGDLVPLASGEAAADLARREALVGRFLAGSRSSAICLYDRTSLSPEQTIALLRTHPLVSFGGGICPNTFAEPPALVLGDGAASSRASWMIAELRLAGAGERSRGELTRRLVAQQDALDRAERFRDDFLAMLAHELRNPLGALSNAVHVLRLRGHGDDTFERAIDTAERQIRYQAKLVDGLLNASRVRRGLIELRREPLDLAALLGEVAREHRPAFDRARVELALRLPGERLAIDGDRSRLAQALSHLLRNALQHTAGGGRVTLAASIVDGRVEVSLADTGVGISAELLPHVFEIFSQGERGLDRCQGGLGVGLAVVKGLVELHGGEIVAASDGPGRGAEFTLRLPLAAPPRPARAAGRRRVADAPAAARGPRRASSSARRILVVEDNPDAASSLRDFLEISGHEVELAHGGQEGVAAARSFHPEVVLCDLGLPGMDGFAVAAELRRDPETAWAQLIAVTGYGRDEDRRRSQAAGFDLHLTKPVNPTQLLQLLQHH